MMSRGWAVLSVAACWACGGGNGASDPFASSPPGAFRPGDVSAPDAAAPPSSGAEAGTTAGNERPRRAGPPAQKVITVLQGQSNAVFLADGDGGYWNVYAPLVSALTGIPDHDAQAARSDFGTADEGYTLASNTATFSFGSDSHELWLHPTGPGGNADDPSTWPPGVHGTAFRNHLLAKVRDRAPDGVPVVVLRFHSEYDSTKQGDEAKSYAAANRRFVSLVREWVGKPAAEVPVFFGMPGFWMNTRDEALHAIRDAWRSDIADVNANCHWMFGNAYDGMDRNDGSHMDEATTQRAAGRAALAVSRWLFENGYAHTDLSWLPGLGPRIVQVRRAAGVPDAIDAVVAHDRGTDLVIPSNVNLDVVSVDDAGQPRKVVGVTKLDATTLRFTLDGSLSGADGQVKVDYNLWPGYYGEGRLVTDDWHTLAKPAVAQNIAELAGVVLPIRRLDQPLVLGAPAVTMTGP